MLVCGKLAFLSPNLSRSSWFDLLMPLVSQILPIYIVIHYLTIFQLISSRSGCRAITEQQVVQVCGELLGHQQLGAMEDCFSGLWMWMMGDWGIWIQSGLMITIYDTLKSNSKINQPTPHPIHCLIHRCHHSNLPHHQIHHQT